MKYRIVRDEDGIEELREDSGDLPAGATALSDEDYSKLAGGNFVFRDGEIVPRDPPA